jgi:hypothetical protein
MIFCEKKPRNISYFFKKNLIMGDIENADLLIRQKGKDEHESSEDEMNEGDEGVVCERKRLRGDLPTRVWMKTFGCQHNFSDSEFMV